MKARIISEEEWNLKADKNGLIDGFSYLFVNKEIVNELCTDVLKLDNSLWGNQYCLKDGVFVPSSMIEIIEEGIGAMQDEIRDGNIKGNNTADIIFNFISKSKKYTRKVNLNVDSKKFSIEWE